jgi:hypothetical protein
MSIVYKYCKQQHGVDILKNLELKITPPNQFNDPFEFSPHMLCCADSRSRSARQQQKVFFRARTPGKIGSGLAGEWCQ